MPHKAPRVPRIAPAYTGRLAMAPVPSLRMPDEAMRKRMESYIDSL